MADRVVGYGFLPTITNNGGKARFTFPASTVFDMWHDRMATDGSCYLWNLTDSEVIAITGKGGSNGSGFYYDTDQDFASLTWTETDRLHPATGNTISNPTSITAAKAAGSAGDICVLAFTDTNENCTWGTTLLGATNAPLMDWYGMADLRSVINVNDYVWQASGDMSARATVIQLCGLFMQSGGSGVYHRGTSSPGVLVHRCLVIAAVIAIGSDANPGNGKTTGQSSVFIGLGANPVNFNAASTGALYNCTVYGGTYCVRNNNGASIYKNVMCSGATTGNWYQMTNAVISYCGSEDATASGAGSLASLTPAQTKFWKNNVGRYRPLEFRILTTSSLYNAGNYAAGQPTVDIDGNDITTTCPIGAHVGTAQAFGVSWPAANQVLDDGTANDFVNFDGAQEASYVPSGGGGVPVIGGHIVRRG